jgi:TonB family protein
MVQAQVATNAEERDAAESLTLKVGGDVIPPRPIFAPEPEYSEEARAAGYQGTGVLSLIVGIDGKPQDVRIVRTLGMQLDEKAIEAVRKWKFEPARKGNRPVPVQINVEVSFRLYPNDKTRRLSAEQYERMLEARSRVQSQVYGGPGNGEPRDCPASLPAREVRSQPLVTIAELNFDGELRMPTSTQDQIATSLKRQTYAGTPDAVVSEIAERVRAAWQDSGYMKVQARGDAYVLTSGPDTERIAITVHVDEDQQYRLDIIQFRNNKAIRDSVALRKLFPLKDGEVFDRAAVAKGLDNLGAAYRDMGYINFTSVPDIRFNEKRQTIAVDIDIDEGKQFYVRRIDIIGLEQPAFENAAKNLLVKRGDIYNQRLVDMFLKDEAALLPVTRSVSEYSTANKEFSLKRTR